MRDCDICDIQYVLILVYRVNDFTVYEMSISDNSCESSSISSLPLGHMIRAKVRATLKANDMKTSGALIQNIHPDVNVKYNSVNVIVGKQSMGKTVIALEEIIKISLLGTHHLLIYVTKNGDENDVSFQSLKKLLKIPYVTVSEKESKSFVEELIAAKNLYYLIRRERLEDKIDESQKQDMFNVLHISDFSKDFLHTIILFDDISNNKLFSSEEGFFSQQIRRCRHTNISYFLLIQGWKGIKPHVKNEITTLFIFPCFNRQQLRFIYGQSASNMEFDDFYRLYQQMISIKNINPDAHPYMIVQITDGGDTFICG